MMPDIDSLLNRYYKKELSSEELDCLFKAFLTDPQLAERHPKDARLIKPLALRHYTYLGLSRIESSPLGVGCSDLSCQPIRRSKKLLRIAAVAVLILGISLTLYYTTATRMIANTNLSDEAIYQWYELTITNPS